MSWILLSLLSAVLLGFYEAAKKTAVRDNAVPAVLFCCVLIGAVIWVPVVLLSGLFPSSMPISFLVVASPTAFEHLYLFIKSALVGASWSFAYFALKRLPVSIAGPIRSIGPAVTILFAAALMGERPTLWQWLGIGVVVIAFYAVSLVSQSEGIHFRRDKGVGMMVIATILGACSGLYDKYLLQNLGMDAATVQAWFSIYLVVVLFPQFLFWYVRHRNTTPFQWRWTIPMVTMALTVADFLYFTAIAQPGALIAVISPVRRTSIVVSFLIGICFYGEKNFRPKAICIVVLLIGVAIVSLAGK